MTTNTGWLCQDCWGFFGTESDIQEHDCSPREYVVTDG